MNINSLNNASYLFSSMNTSGTGSATSANQNILADYASIKNGSYGKLVKAYYKKVGNAKPLSTNPSESKAVNTDTATEASKLKSSADALTASKSLFEKKTVKDSEGNEKKDYDWDTITDKVQSFIKDYNATVKKAGDSDSTGVLRSASNMVTSTAANANSLAAVGIEINKDNTLSLNKEDFKKSDIADVKSLFSGVGSFAYNVSTSAGLISSRATSAAAEAYTSSGRYAAMGSISGVMDAYF